MTGLTSRNRKWTYLHVSPFEDIRLAPPLGVRASTANLPCAYLSSILIVRNYYDDIFSEGFRYFCNGGHSEIVPPCQPFGDLGFPLVKYACQLLLCHSFFREYGVDAFRYIEIHIKRRLEIIRYGIKCRLYDGGECLYVCLCVHSWNILPSMPVITLRSISIVPSFCACSRSLSNFCKSIT